MCIGSEHMRVNENKPPIFEGAFAKDLYDFIAYKQALGYKYYAVAENLTMFDSFSLDYGSDDNKLSKSIVNAWIEKRKGEQPQTQVMRISAIREFGKFLQSKDVDAYVVPLKTGAKPQKYIPYIFTHAEIAKIFSTSDAQCHVLAFPNSHLSNAAILRVLYGTGMRISEVLALKVSDIDIETGIIKVTDTKFGKNRLIPISDSLKRELLDYLDKTNPTDILFPNRKNSYKSKTSVYGKFRRILLECGISHGGRGKGPRLHDLRHTFSVHSIAQMTSNGMDLYVALPILATYLGHSKISTTNQYVRLTAEFYPEIIKNMENTCGFVFPTIEVANDEETN